MSSVGGRISSSRLVQIRRRPGQQIKEKFQVQRAKKQQIEKQEERPVSVQIIESPVPKEIPKIENVEEPQNKPFKLLSNEGIDVLFKKITARKEKFKKLKRQKSKAVGEGKLKNGVLTYDKLDEESDPEEEYEEDLRLSDSNTLPLSFGEVPIEFIGKPLEELDPYIRLRYLTFLILEKRFKSISINRFSSTKSLFLFSPFNLIRRVCLGIICSQFFDFFMILAILCNSIVLAIDLNDEQSNINEYVFTTIYTIEMILKIIAKGFILHPYTYLRDPWNWLDFIVVLLTYTSIILTSLGVEAASTLKLFRVFRIFKTVNIIPGLKLIVTAIFKSLKSFCEVLILMIIFIMVFSLFGLHAFKGSFSQKCVLNYNASSGQSYSEWIQDSNNWLEDPFIGDYMLCSNSSIDTNEGRLCLSAYCKLFDQDPCLNYTCLRVGPNPDYGLTQFDDIWHSMMLIFQVICLDNWEDVYNRVIDTQGPWNVLYFLPIIFIGSFYLINLMLAVVALAYEIECENAKKLTEAPVDNQNDKALVFNLSKLRELISDSQQFEYTIDESHDDDKLNSLKTIIRTLIVSNKLQAELKRRGSFMNTAGDMIADCDPKISQIKVSENLGVLNSYIDAGKSSCKLPNEKIVDPRNFSFCLNFGFIYYKWVQFENLMLKIVESLYFDLFITFCIILNTIIMAIQYDGQPIEIDNLQDYSNYVISSIFIAEALFKMIAYGKQYFLDSSSWFDLLITLLTIIDFSLPNVQGLSVFRAFRLIKIAKSWKAMRKILIIILRSLKSISYLSLVLFLVLYMFAIIGIDLFKTKYQEFYNSPNNTDYKLNFYGVTSTNNMPRSNFDNIWNSLLSILRVLCGEAVRPLRECWVAAGPLCLVLIYPTTLFGNFIILNLFLAMLLSAFGGDSIKEDEEEKELTKSEKEFKELKEKIFNFIDKKIKSITGKKDIDDTNKSEESNDNQVQPCFPQIISKRLKCLPKEDSEFILKWTKLREFSLRVVDHKVFETFIILTIVVSSILLCFDDVYLKNGSDLNNTLQIVDYVIQVIFFTEMLLKWFAYGLKKYFTDWWCLLDVFIVFVSLLNLILSLLSGGTSISYLKVLRTLRAFRPLKAVSRLKGLKVVINALGNSIPEIINVLIVCLIFWLIFSIMGVQLLKGRFYSCYASNGSILDVQVKDKNDCLSLNGTQWYNQKVNFDNVLNGYLALLHIATFSGWQLIIQYGVDVTDKDLQPIRENNPIAYAYFLIFIIFGAFLTLNLFIGVLIDNFNSLKKKYEDKESDFSYVGLLTTDTQKKYLEIIKSLIQHKPKKAIPRPQIKFLQYLFDICFGTVFDIVILSIAIINVIWLSLEYYEQSENYKTIISIINTIFITIYALEMLIKLMACRFFHFFREFWNNFDFLVTILCIFNVIFNDQIDEFIILPSTFRALRILRLSFLLRHVTFAKGLRTILYALLNSIPALFNIGLLLFLIIFIYSILGMNLFLNIQLKYLTPTMNFQTFAKSFLLLFRVGTISGWDELLQQLMLQSTDPNPRPCNDSFDIQSYNNTAIDPIQANGCGNPYFAIPFLVSYIFIVRLIMINMFIAIILESYNQVYREDEIGLTNEDIENFYLKWLNYDLYATQFIQLDCLYDFVANLDQPLCIPKPNELKIISLNIPIYENNLVHCADILHALIRSILDLKDDENRGLIQELSKNIDKHFFTKSKGLKQISSTLERKKQDLAARILQRAWKNYKLQMKLKNKNE